MLKQTHAAVTRRARGIDLVSPEDLRKACDLFESKNLPVRLESFSSGVLVIRSAESSSTSEAAAISELMGSHAQTGMDASEIAQVRPLIDRHIL